MNILEVFFNLFKTLLGVFIDALSQINSVIVTVFGFIKDFLNIFKDLLNSIANVPIIGSIFSPILGPAIALLNIFGQIIDAIITILNLIGSFYNWIKNNLDITTYLIILAGLAFLTTFPVVGALISKLPTPALIMLFLVPLLPAIIYIVQVYVQNRDKTVALEYTKYIVFNAIPFMIANFDVVAYFLLIGLEFTLLQDPTLYATLKEALPRVLFFNLLVLVLGITFLPILFFAYYYLVYKITAVMDTLQKVRQNVIRVCFDNLDVGLYALFIFNVFLVITDEVTQQGLKELLPEFLYMNLNIILVFLAAVPIFIILYFSLTRGISPFDAVGNVRDLIYSIGNNISSAFVLIFKIKPIVFNVQSDPNPGLKPAERAFFARLFGDDLTRAPYNDPLKYPFYQNLPNSTADPRLLYSELNREFYGDANYQKDLYPDYFDQGEKAKIKMTRATYIAIPFLQLSSSSSIMSKLDKVIFRCFGMNPSMPIDKTNPNKIISSISDISDATIRSYATGQNYVDPNTWKGVLTDSASREGVLQVTRLLADGYALPHNNVYYSDTWLQQFCLQIKGSVPLNLYQIAYAATGANYSQSPNPVYDALYTLLTTQLTINGQSLAQNPIAFWNYGYAAAQQANISSFIGNYATNSYYDVAKDFESKLVTTSTASIISYFFGGTAQLPNNTLIDPSTWLKQLYKTITGNQMPENVSVWELAYKSMTNASISTFVSNSTQEALDSWLSQLYCAATGQSSVPNTVSLYEIAYKSLTSVKGNVIQAGLKYTFSKWAPNLVDIYNTSYVGYFGASKSQNNNLRSCDQSTTIKNSGLVYKVTDPFIKNLNNSINNILFSFATYLPNGASNIYFPHICYSYLRTAAKISKPVSGANTNLVNCAYTLQQAAIDCAMGGVAINPLKSVLQLSYADQSDQFRFTQDYKIDGVILDDTWLQTPFTYAIAPQPLLTAITDWINYDTWGLGDSYNFYINFMDPGFSEFMYFTLDTYLQSPNYNHGWNPNMWYDWAKSFQWGPGSDWGRVRLDWPTNLLNNIDSPNFRNAYTQLFQSSAGMADYQSYFFRNGRFSWNIAPVSNQYGFSEMTHLISNRVSRQVIWQSFFQSMWGWPNYHYPNQYTEDNEWTASEFQSRYGIGIYRMIKCYPDHYQYKVSDKGWAYYGYQAAYNMSYYQIMLDPANIIGDMNTLSNRLNWTNTWPRTFLSLLNNSLGNAYMSDNNVDYDFILYLTFKSLASQLDSDVSWLLNFSNLANNSSAIINNTFKDKVYQITLNTQFSSSQFNMSWLNKFYNLATQTTNTLSQSQANLLLYNTANTLLSNVGGTGPATSGNTVTNPTIFFREDMPDSWIQVFVGNQGWSLRGKSQTAFTSMVTAVLSDQQNKSSWIYTLFSLIGDNLPESVAQTYKDIFYNQFQAIFRTTSPNIGGDSNWLVKFYNGLIPGRVQNTNTTLMADILFYGLQAAQITLNSDLRTTYTTNTTSITVDWGSYIFINATDLQNYRSSSVPAISYQVPQGSIIPQGSPWPWIKNSNNTFDKRAYKTLWPNLVSNNIVLEPPTTDDSGNDLTQPNSSGKYSSLYISYCNACFIQNSIAEFKAQLALSANAYAQSVERFNLYAYHAGIAANPLDPNAVPSVTNPDFAMTLIQLKNYVYTFANGTKSIVMFNDFLRYSVLPTSYTSAQANFADSLDSIFNQEIILLEKGNSPTSSSNIFSVADIVLELVANGVKLNNILGLYNNLRKANIEFLFRSMSTNGTINPGSTINQSNIVSINDNLEFTNSANTSELYSSSKLVGLDKLDGEAQVANVLSAFTKSIRQQNIEQAVQDSPGQNGITDDGKIKDYGGPYIRRLFYDAAGVLNSIYTDLFTILQKNVCHQGSNYVPSANDPLDMIWFRYDVQNWQNPFDGLKYGDGKYNPKTNKSDGFNSYICGGYRDWNIHNKNIQNVLQALDSQIVSTSGTGIYNRLFSLLDYIASYNNIISKIYTSQQLGPNAVNMLNQLQNNLSNKYLRLGQNNKYMDLISLCAGNYQHFHINLPLDVPVYSINDGGKSLQENIAKMSISSVADLGSWLSKNMSYDPLYPQFKDEIATAFIFKTIWDLIWWPQFCYEYYYRNPQDNSLSLVHRFNSSMSDPSNPANCIANGKLLKGFSTVTKELGNVRTKSQYFSRPDNNPSTFDMGSLPNITNLLSGQNAQILWKSMCYSYQHDAMLGYLFFTSTISGRPAGYSSINISQTPVDKRDYYTCTSASYTNGYGNNLINDSDNSTMMTPYAWLSMNTSIGGTSLPTQITAASNSPGATNAPSLGLYTKFGYVCGDIERKSIRAQFFADPMSWIDTDRAYQIYPLTFGIYPGNVANYNPTYPAWVYKGISPLKTNWQFSANGYTDVLYKITDPSKLSVLNPLSVQAYAPLIDISLNVNI